MKAMLEKNTYLGELGEFTVSIFHGSTRIGLKCENCGAVYKRGHKRVYLNLCKSCAIKETQKKRRSVNH